MIKFFSVVSFILFLSSCETPRSSSSDKNLDIDFRLTSGEDKEKQCYDFSFTSMGTLWRLVYCSKKSSFLHENLKASVIAKASEYDETFSNWSAYSELTKLQDKGFKKEVCPSSFFMTGLELAKELYSKTRGGFDISLGDGDFTSLAISSDKKCFSFLKAAPKALDFNGLVKGMAVADVARKLYKIGLRDFYVNAGNGNLAYRVSKEFQSYFFLDSKMFPFGHDVVYFLSQSNTHQTHEGKTHQHIQEPSKKHTLSEGSSKVVCYSTFSKCTEWVRLGGISDALSTVLSFNENLPLPQSCHLLEAE